jgi:hypothetical protein
MRDSAKLVLGVLMNWIGARYALLLGAIIGLKAYADFTDPSQKRVFVAGSTLSLVDESGQCGLSLEGAAPLMLAIKWPCAFSQDRTGKPRVERFENTLIVIARHSIPKPAPSRDCDSEQQAIRLIDGRLEASSVMRSAGCFNGPEDQKNFTALFGW